MQHKIWCKWKKYALTLTSFILIFKKMRKLIKIYLIDKVG